MTAASDVGTYDMGMSHGWQTAHDEFCDFGKDCTMHTNPYGDPRPKKKQASITCPECGRTSFHPEDVRQKYCGNCHKFHDQMDLI